MAWLNLFQIHPLPKGIFISIFSLEEKIEIHIHFIIKKLQHFFQFVDNFKQVEVAISPLSTFKILLIFQTQNPA